MIKSLRHYGIQVEDVQESMMFYQNLGFKIIYAIHEQWEDKWVFVVKMEAEDGSILELVRGDWPNHIAMTIDKQKDGYVQRPSGHRVRFITAPEGTRIELVEEP